MPQYQQSRTCANCERQESRQLPAELAAFEQRRQWSAPCQHCGSESFSSVGTSTPPLDRTLLNEWTTNLDLSFFQQDEDLMMANAESLPLLQEFVQKPDISDIKRATLVSALCVIIYENTFDPADPDATIDRTLAATVVQFLKDHLWLFDEIDSGYLYDYIMDDVYPQLGLSRNSAT